MFLHYNITYQTLIELTEDELAEFGLTGATPAEIVSNFNHGYEPDGLEIPPLFSALMTDLGPVGRPSCRYHIYDVEWEVPNLGE